MVQTVHDRRLDEDRVDRFGLESVQPVVAFRA
jgi:hypothetical protein